MWGLAQQIEGAAALGALDNALMHHEPFDSFNAKSLKIEETATTVKQTIAENSQ
ncbi:hypothetical protein SAMN05421759_1023 [Roseivivax lentus]|uniref:Uncharacterized protein n=1 Tax=Roseivivax lentus TaxID=633194 RepID=A0A1N7KRT2_9RHOB|nr:hypothetical protein [Roseivivax lentus]SIS64206.1 hypothetical protein SAMN05421759_1023 [Roseivivax lentus]